MGEGPEGKRGPRDVVSIQGSFPPGSRTMHPKDTSLMIVLLTAII